MKEALLRLLASAKFWTMLLGLVGAIAARYGFEVDPEVFWAIVGLVGVLIGAQGAADAGKEKAKIEAKAVDK